MAAVERLEERTAPNDPLGMSFPVSVPALTAGVSTSLTASATNSTQYQFTIDTDGGFQDAGDSEETGSVFEFLDKLFADSAGYMSLGGSSRTEQTESSQSANRPAISSLAASSLSNPLGMGLRDAFSASSQQTDGERAFRLIPAFRSGQDSDSLRTFATGEAVPGASGSTGVMGVPASKSNPPDSPTAPQSAVMVTSYSAPERILHDEADGGHPPPSTPLAWGYTDYLMSIGLSANLGNLPASFGGDGFLVNLEDGSPVFIPYTPQIEFRQSKAWSIGWIPFANTGYYTQPGSAGWGSFDSLPNSVIQSSVFLKGGDYEDGTCNSLSGTNKDGGAVSAQMSGFSAGVYTVSIQVTSGLWAQGGLNYNADADPTTFKPLKAKVTITVPGFEAPQSSDETFTALPWGTPEPPIFENPPGLTVTTTYSITVSVSGGADQPILLRWLPTLVTETHYYGHEQVAGDFKVVSIIKYSASGGETWQP